MSIGHQIEIVVNGRRTHLPSPKYKLTDGDLGRRIRTHVLLRDRGRCVGCGFEGESPRFGKAQFIEVDHVVPRSKGGTHHPDNLQALCNRCNSSKGTADAVRRPGGKQSRLRGLREPE